MVHHRKVHVKDERFMKQMILNKCGVSILFLTKLCQNGFVSQDFKWLRTGGEDTQDVQKFYDLYVDFLTQSSQSW